MSEKRSSVGKKILVAGALVLDVVPVFMESQADKERVAAGGTVYLKRIDTAIGGAVGNTGLALHRLGADTVLFSKVGADDMGHLVKKALESAECRHYVAVEQDMNTSTSVIVAKPGQDRMILHSRGASQKYRPEDIPDDLLKENDLFHFGYPTGMECMYTDGGENLSALYKRVKSFGLTTSMDLSFPGIDTPSGLADWKEILKKTLPYVDVFLPSFEELLLILDRERYLSLKEQYPGMGMKDIFSFDLVSYLAQTLIDMGVKIAVIKCGEIGSYVKTGAAQAFREFGKASEIRTSEWTERELFAPPCRVDQIVSTNGAGDTFVAGFLQGILLGRSAAKTLHFAAATAAARIASPRGRDGIPEYGTIDEKLEKEQKSAAVSGQDMTWLDNLWGPDGEPGVFIRKCGEEQ